MSPPDLTFPATPLWTGLGAVAPLNAFVQGGPLPRAITGVSIDTRTLQPGELYVAIKGNVHDGHDFVAAAFDKGAAGAVIDEAHMEACRGLGPLYVVANTLKALEGLGRAARARAKGGIVAVTGSVGKTGTKDMLRVALSPFGAVHTSAASFNNHWGVPLTLSRLAQDAAFGVFEIGMNHAGEITPLVDMVRPQVAIITTIAPVHLENFASIEAIADAKAEIFTGLVPGGTAILNRDNAQFSRLKRALPASGNLQLLTFGEQLGCDGRLLEVEPLDNGSRFVAEIKGETINFVLGAPGKHLAMNAMAVLLAVAALGQDVPAAARNLASFSAPGGRGQRHVLGDPKAPTIVIDESYNANPTSMAAALDLLGQTPKGTAGRRIAVLGDMLELGPQEAELHKGLLADLTRNHVDRVYAAGPLMAHLFATLPSTMAGLHAETSDGLIAPLLQYVGGDDVIMVKGSNGSRMAPVVAALIQHFKSHKRAKSKAD